MRTRHFGAILMAVLLSAAGWWLYEYTAKRPLAPAGGLYFPVEKVIDVPQFFQGDARWGAERLGFTSGTLSAEGCAVASAAMVFAGYGADIDPGRLNRFARDTGRYTAQGWLYWEAPAEYAPELAELAYEDKPSYWLIDQNLLAGNPVIVRVRLRDGLTHFVVIVGKRGFDYLIRDPGSGGLRGVYPLRDLGPPIEALRFYRRLEMGGKL